jgi:hypothetical protein
MKTLKIQNQIKEVISELAIASAYSTGGTKHYSELTAKDLCKEHLRSALEEIRKAFVLVEEWEVKEKSPVLQIGEMSVIAFLKGAGFPNFYSDKRKDGHYRIKVTQSFTESQLSAVKKLESLDPLITVRVEKLSIPSWQSTDKERKNNDYRNGYITVPRIIVRTPSAPSKLMIKNLIQDV